MSEPKLGQLVEAGVQRDAVHVAIAPVYAFETLEPGTHVGIVGPRNNQISAGAERLVGIVDPYLKEPVLEGQQCYLWMYPNTVQRLRHDWSHPALEHTVEASKAWIRNFIEEGELDLNLEECIAAAHRYLDTGYHLTLRSSLDSIHTDQTFWHHFQNVTGRAVDPEEYMFITCSC